MARYSNQIQTNMSQEEVISIFTLILQREGFSYCNFKGQPVWKKGQGLVAAPQFINFSYYNHVVTIEAWLKFAWLPGVYSGEMNLEGFWGFAIKAVLKKRVYMLECALNGGQPNTQYYNVQAQVNQQASPVYTTNSPTSFCTGCGTPINPQSQFCSKCGKQK